MRLSYVELNFVFWVHARWSQGPWTMPTYNATTMANEFAFFVISQHLSIYLSICLCLSRPMTPIILNFLLANISSSFFFYYLASFCQKEMERVKKKRKKLFSQTYYWWWAWAGASKWKTENGNDSWTKKKNMRGSWITFYPLRCEEEKHEKWHRHNAQRPHHIRRVALQEKTSALLLNSCVCGCMQLMQQ